MASTLALSIVATDAAEADRYAGELREALLDSLPAETKVTRTRTDPEAMQFGETIVIDVVAAVIVHGVIEGIRLFQERRKVPVRLELDGKPLVVEQVSPDLATSLMKQLGPSSE